MAEASAAVNLTGSRARETLPSMGGLWDNATLAHAGQSWLAHGALGDAMKFLSSHTGLPVTVIAGSLIVLSLRLVRRALAVFLEIGVAVAALATATHLGWISW